MASDRESATQRLRLALELYEFGEAMLRQRIARENPGMSEGEIEARIRAWLSERPGAEHGDAVGRAGSRLRGK